MIINVSHLVFPPVGLSHTGIMTGREKGCYFAAENQNSEKMNKSSNRPKDCPGSPAKDKGIPNLSGRTDFNFNRN